MIEAQKVRAIATGGELGETKGGTAQVGVAFQILAGPNEGETITWYGNLGSPKAQEIAFKALRNCGWQGYDLTDLTGIDTNEVELDIQHEEWEGKTSAKVKWVNAPGTGPAVKPLDPAKKKAVAAEMRNIFKAMDAEAGVKPSASGPQGARPGPIPARRPSAPPQSTGTGRGPSDEDIPF